MNLNLEARRTTPDYIAFCPRSTDRATRATGNEHFLVEKLGDGTLFAVWTQSSYEGATDQHIVRARSRDGGATWEKPRAIAGPNKKFGPATMASWAFPLVSRSGRIYVLFNRHIGVNDIFSHTTGLMSAISSDDGGDTWSAEAVLPMPRSIRDNPDPKIPANWIVWQKPIRLSDGKYFTGFTRWTSPKVLERPVPEWWAVPSHVEFMRFENVDDDPEPSGLKITWLAANKKALRAPLREYSEISVIQEPSIVQLPDKRLFCVMRTVARSPYWAVSKDLGNTWSKPKPLLYRDGGAPVLHPISPCPIYPVGDAGYAFFYHNHDGNFLNWTHKDWPHHRRPLCLARGAFRPNAKQPVWFSEPWYFMDNGGVKILRKDLAMYASTTPTKDGVIFWYPDRKFFLLGKNIAAATLETMHVPEDE